jgi:hypothetical protein
MRISAATVLMTEGELRACDNFHAYGLGNIFTLHLLLFNFSSGGVERLLVFDSFKGWKCSSANHKIVKNGNNFFYSGMHVCECK